VRDAVDRPLLCFVSSLRRLRANHADNADSRDRLIDRIREAAAAGVGLVQIREPHLADSALHVLVSRAVDAVQGTPCRLLVNDRLDLALAAGAHGVHLRADSFTPDRVRSSIRGPLIVGRSIHSTGEAAEFSRQGGVDYLIFGTVFPAASKPPGHPIAGLAALAAAVRAAAPVPVLAIGGVTVETAADAAAAGAAGIAGIGLCTRRSGGCARRSTMPRGLVPIRRPPEGRQTPHDRSRSPHATCRCIQTR
jgi:thiamine-phosphate diphosphorylase